MAKDVWDMSDEELEAAFLEAKDSEVDVDTGEEVFDETPMEEEDLEVEVDSTEDLEDGSEQPEDSDHDTGVEEEVGDEAAEGETDTGTDGDPEQSTDEAEAEPETTPPTQTYSFKANGKDYEFTSEEIAEQFPKIFGQAMDYTKKMQAIKPWRKTVDALEEAKLNHNDVNLMIDVLKGDKTAITEVLKRTGVDTLDLDTDTENPYVANDYGRDSQALAIKDVVETISNDPEYAVTQNILAKEWDDQSWKVFSEDPSMIAGLHEDVKSGMFATLQPTLEKLKLYDGGKKSDLEYYKQAAIQHSGKINAENSLKARDALAASKKAQEDSAKAVKEAERLAAVKAQADKRQANVQASNNRRNAAPTKNVATGRSVTDYLGDIDEAYDDWYQKLQDS